MLSYDDLKIKDSEILTQEKWNGLVEKIEERDLEILNTLTINSGKVGLGTDNPKEAFQIGDRWTFHSGGSKYIGYNSHWEGGANKRLVEGYASILGFDANGSIQIKVGGASTGIVDSPISFIDALEVKKDGKVGIGTTDPKALLHVQSGTIVNGVTIGHATEELKYPWPYETIGVKQSNYNLRLQSPNGVVIHTDINDKEADNKNKARVTIDKAGNVGIGTTDPKYSLEVTDTIKSKNLRCNYLIPEFKNDNYEFIRLGEENRHFGGLMFNKKSQSYGTLNSLSIFTYANRDINIRPGTGKTNFVSGTITIKEQHPLYFQNFNKNSFKIFEAVEITRNRAKLISNINHIPSPYLCNTGKLFSDWNAIVENSADGIRMLVLTDVTDNKKKWFISTSYVKFKSITTIDTLPGKIAISTLFVRKELSNTNFEPKS